MIKFNVTPVTGDEMKHISHAVDNKKLCGDGYYSKLCESWFEDQFGALSVMLTPSCTAALEMAAIILNISPGDEVIMPSYTFVSTANAFVIHGAKIVFVDIDPTTMNIDVKKIESAITPRTKAIVPVHYAGIGCDMDAIMELAEKHNLKVIEDAAQGVMSQYKGKHLGTIGHIGCYSFHETKNYTSGGEGGAILINDSSLIERAKIIREKGTNRSLFLRGAVDKYTWIDVGSSFLPSEIQAAYLYAQLGNAKKINENRLDTWELYNSELISLALDNKVSLPIIPTLCQHNAHMFYIKCDSIEERSSFIEFLRAQGVESAFHYIPLHSAPYGVKAGYFHDTDVHTTVESEKLVRLPLWYNIPKEDVMKVIASIHEFFNDK
ncbi:dTDP-4-amino-4,6-dideoxygalactose transaminase [Vibrio lentus]|uniref:dTDP-4-amino-4,6-dideoxygalactose transaminase n=1 Tax=Vibrio lentus TaxID=136468 RepID=UPI002479A488|nr:dTDP-4-amino-4,6-dideoxygalactose transaminase [Vibrio lentus]WGS60805.1 dTDP-4-amino-4,6-dideoxygalactose transaminase [Vibrio lentus]